jgi:uncharacterized protein (DUF433 family)
VGQAGNPSWRRLIGRNVRQGKASRAKYAAHGVFKDIGMPVPALLENLESGVTVDEFIELYDGLTRDRVEAVFDFAARSLEPPA